MNLPSKFPIQKSSIECNKCLYPIIIFQNNVKPPSVSPPISGITSSNRKLPADATDRPGSWNSSHSTGGAAKTNTTKLSAGVKSVLCHSLLIVNVRPPMFSTTHSRSQTDVSSHNSPKPRARSKAMSKEEAVRLLLY